MKKHFVILAALMFLLAGCSGSGETPSGSVSQLPDPPAATTGSTLETIAPTEATEAPTEATEAPTEAATVSLGRMEGGIYTNHYVGYGCELDSNWAFYTAEELQSIPENIAEILNGSDLDSDSVLTQIADMMAENVNDMTTINILYNKLPMSERLTYAMLTEDEIADLLLESLFTVYEQAGFQAESIEKVKVSFLGEERTALLTSMSINGIPYFALQLFDYKLGQYGVTTTFASYMENNTLSLLELFYAVD